MPEGTLKPGDESELAARIREPIGVGPFEPVEVVTPQFERTDGRKVYWCPSSAEELDKVREAPRELLRNMCLSPWNSPLEHPEKMVLWLYPGEWYEHIPAGYPIVDICDQREKFEPGVTDDDIRFGCLAYGFLREPEPEDLDPEGLEEESDE